MIENSGEVGGGSSKEGERCATLIKPVPLMGFRFDSIMLYDRRWHIINTSLIRRREQQQTTTTTSIE